METKTAFIRFISNEYSVDYWSDVAIERAIELADEMSPTEWADLCENWTSLDPKVQARVAEVASETSTLHDDICPMLISMLCSSSRDVVEASLDSLNSICQQMPDRIDKENLKQGLRGVSSSDAVVSRVLDSLRQKINT